MSGKVTAGRSYMNRYEHQLFRYLLRNHYGSATLLHYSSTTLFSLSPCTLTQVFGCVSDVDMCDGNRIDRPQYVGHCSNRPHHRPDTCTEIGDRYELVFRWK